MNNICMIYIITSSKEEAIKIGKKLLNKRLVSCMNVFNDVNSFYWWNNEIQKDNEAVLIVKTKQSLFSEIEETVKFLHSYECPCIVGFPIVFVNKEYRKWVIRETK